MTTERDDARRTAVLLPGERLGLALDERCPEFTELLLAPEGRLARLKGKAASRVAGIRPKADGGLPGACRPPSRPAKPLAEEYRSSPPRARARQRTTSRRRW